MKKFLICTIILLAFTCSARAAEVREGFYPAKLRDISDRVYEPSVIKLLDNATESIVMSMYILKPGQGPVNLLINDLVEAAERGVSVRIYLNTKFHSKKEADVIGDKAFHQLKEAGAVVKLYSPNYRVHDKLIIVDSRYVVEGSTNWSVSALKTNYESATLIDSPELARVKLRRLDTMPLKGETIKKPEEKAKPLSVIGDLPKGETLELKKVLFEKKNYFPEMVKTKGNRAMDIYLLFLIESKKNGKTEFSVSLESLAATLKLPKKWTNAAKRRQMIKALRSLKNTYKLIDFEFSHGDDAYVVLKDLPGETFTVKDNLVSLDFLTSKTASGQFVAFMNTLLESEGQAPQDFSYAELTKRFHVKYWGLKAGREEIGGE